MHDDDVRHLGDERHGREAPLAVIGDVLVEVWVGDGGTDRAQQKRLPSGRALATISALTLPPARSSFR